jgi:vesicular inhibitory amino acid transporter
LQRCIDSSPLIHTYPDIGAHAFGGRGHIVIAAFMYLKLYLVAIDFKILEGYNVHKLFPAVSFQLGVLHVGGKQAFVLAATLVVCRPHVLATSTCSRIATGSALMSVILIADVLGVGVFDGVGFHKRGRWVHWVGMPSVMSLYLFCFSDVFSMIYTGMKDRNMFPMVR